MQLRQVLDGVPPLHLGRRWRAPEAAEKGAAMAKVTFGNHAALRVPQSERERFRAFCRDVLGCEMKRMSDQKDDVCVGGDFYLAVLYEDGNAALDEGGFLGGIYLELKADDVQEVRRRIVAFGVKVLDVPDPHLYFQAPGGQVLRLVGTDEDLSKYEGTDHGEQFVGVTFESRMASPEARAVEQVAPQEVEHGRGSER
jgi:hypothetical protein